MNIKSIIRINLFSLLIIVFYLASSCKGNSFADSSAIKLDTLELRYANNLTLIDHGNFMKAIFRNPWDTTKVLQTYLLIPRGNHSSVTSEDGVVLRIPLTRSLVYTSMHANLIYELGALDAMIGACDAKYMYKTPIRQRLDNGSIADCGISHSPNIEKIISLNPDAILLSAFEDSRDHNKVSQFGIPIIDCIDYMESSPLGRAEWMRFYGRLFGKGEVADSIFLKIENAYLNTKDIVKNVKSKPKVIMDHIYGSVWYMPAGNSFVGTLIQDAGGLNPFAHYKQSGSVMLAPEEVLYSANDADVWLIKYSQNLPASLTQLGTDNPIYSKFKAFKMGEVYGCNSKNSSYFEDASFHPHWILAEFVNIFHPEIDELSDNHHYYSKIKQ